MDVQKLVQNPANYFKHPKEIIESNNYSIDEKIKMLESWAYDIQELEKAEEENMSGNDNYTLLRQIKNMLLDLKKS